MNGDNSDMILSTLQTLVGDATVIEQLLRQVIAFQQILFYAVVALLALNAVYVGTHFITIRKGGNDN